MFALCFLKATQSQAKALSVSQARLEDKFDNPDDILTLIALTNIHLKMPSAESSAAHNCLTLLTR